jgi:hypothetical protein
MSATHIMMNNKEQQIESYWNKVPQKNPNLPWEDHQQHTNAWYINRWTNNRVYHVTWTTLAAIHFNFQYAITIILLMQAIRLLEVSQQMNSLQAYHKLTHGSAM